MDRLPLTSSAVRATAFGLALVAGLAVRLAAGEPNAWPGPELQAAAQGVDRLPTVEDPSDDSLHELPPAGEASPLPTAQTDADGPAQRSEEIEQIAQQADRQTRHALELAGRNAFFAARSECLSSMRLVAEGLDTEQKSNVHGRALAAAVVAMREAEDFIPGPAQLEAPLDLPAIVALHTTPVLKDRTEGLTSMSALRSYFTFAQEHFAVAVGHEVAGSMSLYAMGKLHAAIALNRSTAIAASESKAMVFYQASLLAYPQNFMAANDLGVLLARCGRYADARAMLERSVAACPQSTGWRNLAVVYERLGQKSLADQASKQSTILRRNELARRKVSPTASNDMVQWVDPQVFARTPSGTRPTIAPTAKPQAGRASSASKTDDAWPAPTPAAAGRMSWEARKYKR